MKKINVLMTAFFAVLFLNSCGLSDIDNYDGPDSRIYGGIYDLETGELVQQDILQGTQLEYVEDGFANPEIQYMVIKNDGTYDNKMMFASTYTIQPVRGNFVNVPKKGVQVQGDTRIDFQVQPFIRVKNARIEKQGNKVMATFNIQQTVPGKVARIALFAHQEPNVGNPLHTVKAEMIINATTYENTEYTLEIDLEEHAGRLKAGGRYFFRIGALIDQPEAKFNYAPAVHLPI